MEFYLFGNKVTIEKCNKPIRILRKDIDTFAEYPTKIHRIKAAHHFYPILSLRECKKVIEILYSLNGDGKGIRNRVLVSPESKKENYYDYHSD